MTFIDSPQETVRMGISYTKSEPKLQVIAVCFQPFTLLCRQNRHDVGS